MTARDGWEPRLRQADDRELESAVERLFEQQAAAWPLLAAGLAGLARASTRPLRMGQVTLALRHIPHRMKSTSARVDATSIAARPCFLCEQNLPPQQQGVAVGEEWVALCNPYPILERHLTVVHRRHVPQRLAGRLGALLALARALPRSFVIYNGAACGASAPDHMHFQACARSLLPVAAAANGQPGPILHDYPARPIVLRGAAGPLAETLERALAALAEESASPDEPLVNVAALWDDGRYEAFLFARRKHRPQAFETGDLLVSPAAIDLSGVLVAPREDDYERLTPERARHLLDEVVLDGAQLAAVARRIGGEA